MTLNELLIKKDTDTESCSQIREESAIAFGEQTLNTAYCFILIEANLKYATKPHTFFQLIKNFLKIVASKDPNQFHFDIARIALHRLGKATLQNKHTVDMLARELVTTCCLLNEQLQLPDSIAKLMQQEKTSPKRFCEPSYLTIIELPDIEDTLENHFFTKNGLSIWDNNYLKLIASFGNAGEVHCNAFLKKYKNCDKKWNPLFWFNQLGVEPKGHLFHSPAFLNLATILWEDIVKRRI